jgi:hypothetical protein
MADVPVEQHFDSDGSHDIQIRRLMALLLLLLSLLLPKLTSPTSI